MARFTNAGVRFHVDDLTPIGGSLGAAIDIGGIIEHSTDENVETQNDDSGLLYDQTVSIVSLMPTISLTSKSLRQLFTILSGGFYCYGGGTYPGNVDGTHPGLEVYGRRKHNCKDAAPGSNHAKLTSPAGLLVAQTLNMPRGQDASLAWMAHCLSEDGSDPVTEAFNASVPTTFVEEQFTLGHCMIAGLGINDQVTGMTLEFGVELGEKMPDLGEVVPSSVSVSKIRPRLTITGLDPSIAATLATGTSCTHANTKLQLKKRADRGKFVANGTAEHILITLDGMLVRDTRHAASGSDDATCSWRLETLDDGTNAPVVISPSSTYDTDLTS